MLSWQTPSVVHSYLMFTIDLGKETHLLVRLHTAITLPESPVTWMRGENVFILIL